MSARTAPPAAARRRTVFIIIAILVPVCADQRVDRCRVLGSKNTSFGFFPLLFDVGLGRNAVGDSEIDHLAIVVDPRGHVVGRVGQVGEGALVRPADDGRQDGIARNDDKALCANVVDIDLVGRHQLNLLRVESACGRECRCDLAGLRFGDGRL